MGNQGSNREGKPDHSSYGMSISNIHDTGQHKSDTYTKGPDRQRTTESDIQRLSGLSLGGGKPEG